MIFASEVYRVDQAISGDKGLGSPSTVKDYKTIEKGNVVGTVSVVNNAPKYKTKYFYNTERYKGLYKNNIAKVDVVKKNQ